MIYAASKAYDFEEIVRFVFDQSLNERMTWCAAIHNRNERVLERLSHAREDRVRAQET